MRAGSKSARSRHRFYYTPIHLTNVSSNPHANLGTTFRKQNDDGLSREIIGVANTQQIPPKYAYRGSEIV